MADFTVLILKIAFLAVLWLFIVVVAAVVNSDMVGRRQRRPRQGVPARAPAANPPRRGGKGDPWVLAIDSGLHAGDRLQLIPEVRIGRSQACELVLDDDYVSQVHARLSHGNDGRWVLSDMGSTNGTYVNSQRILTPTVVGVHDIMRIGDVQMRLET